MISRLQEESRSGTPAVAPERQPERPDRHAVLSRNLLRCAAGLVFFFFGILKLFPDLSPAELIVSETLTRLSAHSLGANTVLRILGAVECAVGTAFLLGFLNRTVLTVFLLHQASTFIPLFIVPELCFKIAPFAPTLEGQYILKNLISVAAGIAVLWPAVRGSARASKEEPA